MDHLWTPWRYAYLAGAHSDERKGVPDELASWPGDAGCVFCNLLAAAEHALQNGKPIDEVDRAAGIVLRAQNSFICLNRFPYTSGHVMVLPYSHVGSFAALKAEAAQEITVLAQRTETALQQVYSPDGLNMGMNLGRAAGAGIDGHLHLHILPRWLGDGNFMTAIADTRVLPETLDTTWERLRRAFKG